MSSDAQQPTTTAASPVMTRLLRAASWTLAGAVGSQVLGFLGGLVTARMLGGAGFGQLSAVRGLLLAFGLFSGAGLGLAAVRYVAEFRERDKAMLALRLRFLNRLSWLCAGVTTLLVVLSAPFVARSWLGQQDLSLTIWLGSPLVLFNGLSAIQNGVLGGFEKFKAIARGIALESIGNFLGVVIGVKLAGVNGALLGAAIAGAVAWYYRHRLLQIESRQLPSVDVAATFSDRRWLLHEAMPFVVSGSLSQPFEWYARLALVQQPDGFAQLGYFSAAFTCAQIIAFLPRQFTAPGVALLTGLAAEAGTETAVKVARLKFRMLMLLAAVAAIPMLFAAGFIMKLFGFSVGGDVLVVLVLANLAAVCSSYLRTILSATGKIWWQCAQVAVWSIVLIMAWLALEQFGALGLACAYLMAYAVVLFPQGRAARVSLLNSADESMPVTNQVTPPAKQS